MATSAPNPEDTKIDSRVEHLEDLNPDLKDNHTHVDGNALLVNKDGEVRRIPVPSSDPNDPLNFRKWEKYGLVFCCCWFSSMGLSIASGLGAILSVFFQMYTPQGYSSDEIVLLITIPTLCIGLGKLSRLFLRKVQVHYARDNHRSDIESQETTSFFPFR